MPKSLFNALLNLVLLASLGSVLGLLSGFVISLLIYGVAVVADRAFDFFTLDFYTVPLLTGMMFGALIGAIFGSLLALKKVK